MAFKIYVRNLAKYTEGILKGDWLSLPMCEEELQDALQEILGDDEEYAIHGYENDIGYCVGEYENVYKLNQLVERLESLSEYEQVAVRGFLENLTNDLEQAIEEVESGNFLLLDQVYDEKDLGYALVGEGIFCYEVSDGLKNYLDYEAIGRDYSLGGNSSFMSGGYFIEFYYQ